MQFRYKSKVYYDLLVSEVQLVAKKKKKEEEMWEVE